MEKIGSAKDFSQADKKRVAYIEGREDLFDTKLLSLSSEQAAEPEGKEVLVVARDPGGANALMPVVQKLHSAVSMDLLVDSRAEELFKKNFSLTDDTPSGGALETPVSSYDAILMATSTSEVGAQTYVTANREDRPLVLLEDYYGSSSKYLNRVREAGLTMPEKICVLDEWARSLVVAKFPELEDRVVVTGQPAFDRFATEDTESIVKEVKAELGIESDTALITFVGGMEPLECIRTIAEAVKKVSGNTVFAFRNHPRDPVSYEEYEKLLQATGVSYVNTNHIDMNRMGAATDVVVTVISTEALHAIYRRKPSIHITDPAFTRGRTGEPIPVQRGASGAVEDMDTLATTIHTYLDPQNVESTELRKNMEESYPADGKAAERVVKVVMEAVQ